MEQYHYQYYREFRSVHNLMIHGESGTVELNPSKHLDVLIDGAMQAIVFIYIQQYGSKLLTLVPFYIRKIEFSRITEEAIPIEKYNNANIFAFVKIELQNGRFQGSFKFATDKIAIAADGISFYPMTPDDTVKSLENEKVPSLNSLESQIDSCHQESSVKSEAEESTKKNNLSQNASNRFKLQDERLICIKSFACRLPKSINDPAEFWDALKTGRIMASKIPYSRISGRDSLARGHYGHSIRCANFLANDISHFDAAFFGISRSEAEKIDPQQRILLECVYECMENAGLTSLSDTGFFVGFMSNEYPDIVKSRDAISMLGSSASIVSGRLNYSFGSNGPAITLDTACSSSLVALQTAIHALRTGQCTTAIVAGVNLILTEQSIGQRANGNLLADDGICRSFDVRSSGYGRADGCVALLLNITDKVVSRNDSAISVISTCIGHNGQNASLTVPSGYAQEKLLRDCLSKIANNQPVKYWETHGTGTIIGDAIELKALQANLRQCLISTAKTHFGHSEAAAGATGLAKILLQFKYEYIPEHGSYQFLQNLQNGSLYLPVIGEEWSDTTAGISSFGISGTNAMALLQSEKVVFKPSKTITTKWQTYICPLSAKTGFLSLITFLHDIGIKVKAIHAYDNLSLTATLLIT
ncbi:unnamed protein product, partial [Onchocerca flexuosa]|uniref:PKS_KS domain-containing protein n=1 Tax=Onchocerca flexuosa TaxID=387005 RepID=A0A183HEF4_9BILA